MRASLDKWWHCCHHSIMTNSIASHPPALDEANLATVALRGDHAAVERLLPHSKAADRAEALAMACENAHGDIARRLLDEGVGTEPSGPLNNSLALAAASGMVSLMRDLLTAAPLLDKDAALVRALLASQHDAVAFLAPRSNRRAVMDDFMDNYDDTYQLSYTQMAQRLDVLANFITNQERAYLYQCLDLALLPQQSLREQAQKRAGQTAPLETMPARRPRQRQ
jgi:hypothetical protein